MRLYEIIPQFRSLVDSYNEADTEEEAQSILAQLERVDAAFEDKIDAIVRAWKNEEADIPGISEEIDRLSTLKAQKERHVQAFKDMVKNAILASGIEPKVKISIGTVRVQKNGGNPSVIYEGEAKDLPKAYRTVVPISYEIDRQALVDEHKKFETNLAEALKINPMLDVAEYEREWRKEAGIPEGVFIERGKHVRLQ